MVAGRPFDSFVEYRKRVSPTCLIHFERNRYSVPASFANRTVSLRVYPDRFQVVAEGQPICAHQRIINRSHDGPGHTVYDRSEEHTSELQSLMRISYAVFCLKKKNKKVTQQITKRI